MNPSMPLLRLLSPLLLLMMVGGIDPIHSTTGNPKPPWLLGADAACDVALTATGDAVDDPAGTPTRNSLVFDAYTHKAFLFYVHSISFFDYTSTGASITATTIAGDDSASPGTTWAGNNAVGTSARFTNLGAGIGDKFFSRLYFTTAEAASTSTHRVLHVALSGTYPVTELAGGTAGCATGDGSAAQISEPRSVVWTDDAETHLFVPFRGCHRIASVQVGSPYTVAWIAGSGSTGSGDGNGVAATFNQPVSVVRVGNRLYLACEGTNRFARMATTSPYAVVYLGASSGSVSTGADVAWSAFVPTTLFAMSLALWGSDWLVLQPFHSRTYISSPLLDGNLYHLTGSFSTAALKGFHQSPDGKLWYINNVHVASYTATYTGCPCHITAVATGNELALAPDTASTAQIIRFNPELGVGYIFRKHNIATFLAAETGSSISTTIIIGDSAATASSTWANDQATGTDARIGINAGGLATTTFDKLYFGTSDRLVQGDGASPYGVTSLAGGTAACQEGNGVSGHLQDPRSLEFTSTAETHVLQAVKSCHRIALVDLNSPYSVAWVVGNGNSGHAGGFGTSATTGNPNALARYKYDRWYTNCQNNDQRFGYIVPSNSYQFVMVGQSSSAYTYAGDTDFPLTSYRTQGTVYLNVLSDHWLVIQQPNFVHMTTGDASSNLAYVNGMSGKNYRMDDSGRVWMLVNSGAKQYNTTWTNCAVPTPATCQVKATATGDQHAAGTTTNTVMKMRFDTATTSSLAVVFSKYMVYTVDYTARGTSIARTIIAGVDAATGTWVSDQATGTDARFTNGGGGVVDKTFTNMYFTCNVGTSALIHLAYSGNYPVTSIAGNAAACSEANGASASIHNPRALEWTGDDEAYVYLLPMGCHRIAKVQVGSPYTVSWVAGSGSAGAADGFGLAAQLNSPIALARYRNVRWYFGAQGSDRIGFMSPGNSHYISYLGTTGSNSWTSNDIPMSSYVASIGNPGAVGMLGNCWLLLSQSDGRRFHVTAPDGTSNLFYVEGIGLDIGAGMYQDPTGKVWVSGYPTAGLLSGVALSFSDTCPAPVCTSCQVTTIATGNKPVGPSAGTNHVWKLRFDPQAKKAYAFAVYHIYFFDFTATGASIPTTRIAGDDSGSPLGAWTGDQSFGISARFTNNGGGILDSTFQNLYFADYGQERFIRVATSANYAAHSLAGDGTSGCTEGDGYLGIMTNPADLEWSSDSETHAYVAVQTCRRIAKIQIASPYNVAWIAGDGTDGVPTAGFGVSAVVPDPIGMARYLNDRWYFSLYQSGIGYFAPGNSDSVTYVTDMSYKTGFRSGPEIPWRSFAGKSGTVWGRMSLSMWNNEWLMIKQPTLSAYIAKPDLSSNLFLLPDVPLQSNVKGIDLDPTGKAWVLGYPSGTDVSSYTVSYSGDCGVCAPRVEDRNEILTIPVNTQSIHFDAASTNGFAFSTRALYQFDYTSTGATVSPTLLAGDSASTIWAGDQATGTNARWNAYGGLMKTDATIMLCGDLTAHMLFRIDLSGNYPVTKVAGTQDGTCMEHSAGLSAKLYYPSGGAWANLEETFVHWVLNCNRIVLIMATSPYSVKFVAGDGTAAATDGYGLAAQVHHPITVAHWRDRFFVGYNTGKTVAVVYPGRNYQVTTICSGNTVVTATNLPFGSDYSVNLGAKMFHTWPTCWLHMANYNVASQHIVDPDVGTMFLIEGLPQSDGLIMDPLGNIWVRAPGNDNTKFGKYFISFAGCPAMSSRKCAFETGTMSPTITPPSTPTTTKTSTVTPAPTETHPPTATPSDTSTITPPPTGTATATITPPETASATFVPAGSPSTTKSLSASVSLTSTRSETVTPPSSKTSTETATVTSPPTGTATETITPPPTPTHQPTDTPTLSVSPSPSTTTSLSATDTPSKTFSLSLSPTESLSPTGTLSATFSESLTTSVSVTSSIDTFTLSETHSDELYCGDIKSAEACANLYTTCNTTEDGSCYHQRCSQFNQVPSMCMRMGCVVRPNKDCQSPPECRNVFDIVECQQLLTCRWQQDESRCSLDTVRCDHQITSGECSSAGCTWNSRGVPDKCFKPILAPALCRLVTDSFICQQQNCIWMSDSNYCEAWDMTCATLFPTPSNCPFLPLCVYEASNRSCVSYEGVDFASLSVTTIVSASIPHSVFPDEPFKMELVGSVLKQEVYNLTLVDATTTICDASTTVLPGISTQVIKTYDLSRKANIVSSTISRNGDYAFCVVGTDGVNLGPFGNVTVGTWTAKVSSCSAYPTDPFVAAPFELSSTGKFLDSKYAVYALVNSTLSAPNETECPVVDFTASAAGSGPYTTVSRVDSKGIVHSNTAQMEGKYTMCYANRGGVPTVCPTYTDVTGRPPWLDMLNVVEKIASDKLPVVKGLTITQFNRKYCKSMNLGNETDGVFTHPERWPFKIGDGVVPYAGSEVCAMAVLPQHVKGYDTPVDKVLITDIFYASLNIGDSLRVFGAITSATDPPRCNNLGNYADCAAAACSWDSSSLSCSVGSSTKGKCISSISGYELVREITYNTFVDAGEELSIGTAANDGFIFVACMNQPNVDGLGVSLKYRIQETYCPNDCKDKNGNQNGQCLRKGTWQCTCNSGFAGSDCSRLALCRGTGPLADTITGASGTETLDMQASGACGMNLVIDTTSSNIARLAKFGVGISIGNLQLKSSTAATDCSKNYIVVRSGDYKGDTLATLCPKDLQSSSLEKLRYLVTDATSIYLEYKGYPGDTFDMTYTVVSLVCPGQPSSSGIPTLAKECDGRGTCELLDYTAQTGKLGTAAYGCTCDIPWAASFAGETCDTCAFGYMRDTFPTCLPATICGNNCSGNGTCIPGVGCLCNTGLYGLDCQLDDDGERNQEFLSKDALLHRLPLNAEDVGNVVESGAIDRTLTLCALPGSNRPCRATGRTRGRKFRQQSDKRGSADVVNNFNFRRQTSSGSGSAIVSSGSGSGTNSTLDTSNVTDLGLTINALATKGNYPDFIRTDNVTGGDLDVSGSFTVLAWVQLSAKSNGFLFAKVDSAFMPNGQSPSLNRALEDVLDREILEPDLLSYKALDSLATHFAFYIEGEKKRVSLLASDPSKRGTTGEKGKEGWHYVRHFRLGESSGELFDGSWRWLAVRVYRRNNKLEGQIFVDGFSRIADPNYVQCLPWLPPDIWNTNHSSGPNISAFGHNADGASTIWGYRLKAGLDELQVYDYALNPATIPRLAGLTQLSEVTVTMLIILLTLCSMCILFHIIGIAYYALESKKTTEKVDDKKEDVSQQQETESELGEASRNQEPPHLDSPRTSRSESQNEPVPPENSDDGACHVEVPPLGQSGGPNADAPDPEFPGLSMGMSPEGSPTKVREQEAAAVNSGRRAQGYSNSPRTSRSESQNVEDEESDGIPDESSQDEEVDRESSAADSVQFDGVVGLTHAKMAQIQKYMNNKKRHRHLALLEELQLLREREAAKKETGEQKAASGLAGNLARRDENLTASDLSAMGSVSASSWQILSQLQSGMELPQFWVEIFGQFAHFMSFDLGAAFGTLYAAIFLFTAGLCFIMFVILLVIQLTSKIKPKKELEKELKAVIRERTRCLEENEEYKSSAANLKFKLALGFATMMSIFYIPVTNQALAVVFCHPNLMCI